MTGLSWNRPHAWLAGRCSRCGMHREWPGARHGCEGIAVRDRSARVRKRSGCSGCGAADHTRRTCRVSDVRVLLERAMGEA